MTSSEAAPRHCDLARAQDARSPAGCWEGAHLIISRLDASCGTCSGTPPLPRSWHIYSVCRLIVVLYRGSKLHQDRLEYQQKLTRIIAITRLSCTVWVEGNMLKQACPRLGWARRPSGTSCSNSRSGLTSGLTIEHCNCILSSLQRIVHIVGHETDTMPSVHAVSSKSEASSRPFRLNT